MAAVPVNVQPLTLRPHALRLSFNQQFSHLKSPFQATHATLAGMKVTSYKETDDIIGGTGRAGNCSRLVKQKKKSFICPCLNQPELFD